jgi:hypothetical protein
MRHPESTASVGRGGGVVRVVVFVAVAAAVGLGPAPGWDPVAITTMTMPVTTTKTAANSVRICPQREFTPPHYAMRVWSMWRNRRQTN